MDQGHFERLEQDECVQLLHDATIGRIVFVGPDGLTVVPLSYSVEPGVLVLRTAEETQLAQLPEGAEVAFEVDDFDAEYRNGWSVLVRGTLGRLADDGFRQSDPPQPFVPGERRVRLGVSLDAVSGRAVSADS